MKLNIYEYEILFTYYSEYFTPFNNTSFDEDRIIGNIGENIFSITLI